ncbi:hypothetical protein NIES267_57180 [Calothrix parasitica NIES-267]|uniref:Uncharacterized protein n=1 Tax=Calothrix parasitica NIES-267 TaxID=1973488 RepID=A0A1Z4LYC4_9CYAN|nr:hypothetical protein NIES267_57180 [Calothrix parasitica NIES-267]
MLLFWILNLTPKIGVAELSYELYCSRHETYVET